MPKSKARKKGIARGASLKHQKKTTGTVADVQAARSATALSSFRAQGLNSMQGAFGLMMAAMVALGCWGLAAYYTFIMIDPNHYLFGGLAMLLALMWSVSFGVRLRKWQRRR